MTTESFLLALTSDDVKKRQDWRDLVGQFQILLER